MPDLNLTGNNWIAGTQSAEGSDRFHAFAPAAQTHLDPPFAAATTDEVDRACRAAAEAADAFAQADRAAFLEAIAEEILALGDVLIQRAHEETALPTARLEGERGRTVGQLRMFAEVVRAGVYLDVRHEPALPDRQPLPRPDLRRFKVPLGPVAVFGASNFPLAFSVAGGDTASAFAAGCPVIVKAHPAHPGTSELVAGAIYSALDRCGLPAGVFSMVHGGTEPGVRLVHHPAIQGAGFTGSLRGGMALWRIAMEREVPIPFFAEMGSVNPVTVFPAAMAARGNAIAEGYVQSLTLGVGQFCTNPGVLLVQAGEGLDGFLNSLTSAAQAVAAGTMLTPGILASYRAAAEHLARHPKVQLLTASSQGASPQLVRVSATDFVVDPSLAEEVFGPSGVIVIAESAEEVRQVLASLPGQLTATIHADPADHALVGALLPLLQKMAGRLVFNAFPTGVEVGAAMQHGGPFPATTDPRFTSVGTAAIERWLRPVCFQGFPNDLLPAALR